MVLRKRWLLMAMGVGAVVGGIAGAAWAVGGSVGTHVIQIDPSADLYDNTGDDTAALDAPADIDWVAGMTGNTGSGCLTADGIATCVEAGVTGASGGQGTWNGVRIVDGIGGGDQDIFLTGGKENDVSTWNIGPGTVGSSKYDITQAYLANNADALFFGMERRGNNGTTAFDFEFNANKPGSSGCPSDTRIPCRAIGDILFTFELQGSGGSGAATPYVFRWNGSSYVALDLSTLPAGAIVSSINDSPTAAAPWGFVDAKGNWVLGSLDRFEFAEAAVLIGAGGITLPGVNVCGGTAYVQVRTRSSATPNSDLKDTSRIFPFTFGGLTASLTKSSASNDGTTVTLSASGGGGANTLQLQVYSPSTSSWVNYGNPLSGSSGSLSFNGFSSYGTSTSGNQMSVTIGATTDSYVGVLTTAQLRLHATMTGSPCSADSSSVTVKQIFAADP